MGILNNISKIAIGITIICMTVSCGPQDRYMTINGYAQGGTYTVKLNLNGKDGMIRERPQEIRDSVDALLYAIDNSLSGYNRNSLLSRFNAGETVLPDDLFTEIYTSARQVFDMTAGVVDAASAPLFDLWGFGFTNGSMPSEDEVRKARMESGMGRLKPDMTTAADMEGKISGTSLLLEEYAGGWSPKLNYNAIAQGYSCDVIARYLYSIGVKDMMVEIGEIFCDGHNPSGKPWTLAIDKPVDGNQEPGAHIQGIFRAPEGPHGIVTSGNYRKFYIKDGKKYAHTIDPRTGYPVTHNLLSATIVAPSGMLADAYATYCMVIGLEESKAFLTSRDDLEGCLIYDDNGTFRTWCSEGFVLEEIQD